MGTNPDPMPRRQLDAATHGLRIASMETAGVVCRTDERENVLVWSRPVNSKALSEITINIYAAHGKTVPRGGLLIR
jgi:hypothetical protein